jgi:hypothetical protein
VPLQLWGCLAEQKRGLSFGRSLGRSDRAFHLSTLLNPFMLQQIVNGHLPAFRGAQNESSEMPLRGVESSHEIPSDRILAAAERIAITNSSVGWSRPAMWAHQQVLFEQTHVRFGKASMVHRTNKSSLACRTIYTVTHF